MSGTEPSPDELFDRFRAGEFDVSELVDRLEALEADTDREELWARWAEQGLFNGPIEQDGYTSFDGKSPREVDGDGER